MPHTFLDAVRRAHMRLRISSRPPATVADAADLADNISMAWLNIQGEEDWMWLRREWRCDLTAGKSRYAVGDVLDAARLAAAAERGDSAQEQRSAAVLRDFRRWRTGSGSTRYYDRGSDIGLSVSYMPWDVYRSWHEDARTGSRQPAYWTVAPGDDIAFGRLVGDDLGHVAGEYQAGSQELSLDDDVINIPRRFFDVVVYRGMDLYALAHADQAAHDYAMESKRLYSEMLFTQMPAVRVR